MKIRIALLLCAALAADAGAQVPSYDILIRNARILDGTGSPSFSGIIAVKHGRIAAMGAPAGPLSRATAKR